MARHALLIAAAAAMIATAQAVNFVQTGTVNAVIDGTAGSAPARARRTSRRRRRRATSDRPCAPPVFPLLTSEGRPADTRGPLTTRR